MHPLNRKLLRDIRRLWAQSLAIAAVLACGIMILVMAYGTERSLSETRDTYYERTRFADIWASATRAPKSLVEEIAAIEGVMRVEARIADYAVLDLPEQVEPAVAQVLSIPASGVPLLNVPVLRSGRMPEAGARDEILISETFALAHGYRPGDGFEVTLNGQKRALTIVGTALSAEFIYTVGPGALMPDDQRFGVMWMAEDVLAAAYGLEGAFNSVAVTLTRGTDAAPVRDALEALLKPYGGTGSYLRKDQISNAFLQGELDQLENMADIIPPVFLVISAFLVNMVLGRLIALEREQIGLLKALGYGNGAIVWHYLKLSLLIGAIGVVLGWITGYLMSRAMAAMYVEFFHFPYMVFVPYPATYVISGLAGLAAAMAGAVMAVRRVVVLRPAVAMSPPAPTRFRRGIFDRTIAAFKPRQPTMMILRSLGRWPLRAALTSFGIAISGAMIVAGMFLFDALDVLVDVAFYQTNREDAVIEFAAPIPEAGLRDVETLPGVMRAEGEMIAAATLTHGHLSRSQQIEGLRAGDTLSPLIDGETEREMQPEAGIILSNRMALHLDARPGDVIEIEFLEQPGKIHEVQVEGVVRLFFGMGAYMDIDRLSALLGTAPRIEMANLMLDGSERDALFEAIKDTPVIAGLTLMDEVRGAFEASIAENTTMTITIYSIVAAMIAVGVVYNAARIQLSERARELASLRILGFTRGEVSYILLGEQFILTALAIPMGLGMGNLLAHGLVLTFDSDVYSIPFYISTQTYLFASAIVAVAAIVSALLVRRRIDRMDLVAVMKTRE